MLTKRIIACLDVTSGRVVKGVKFLHLRDAGDPAELAEAHSAAGADEIVLLDISATAEQRSTLLDTVRQAASKLFIPFTVGGGIRSLDDASAVFDAGADKVSINSAALADPNLIGMYRPSLRFASRNRCDRCQAHGREALRGVLQGWTSCNRTGCCEWAKEAERRGAGEILLTSMDRDGTGDGFDCELTRTIADQVRIPVIAPGGAGSSEHFIEVFEKGHADAALAASILHYGTTQMADLKNSLLRRRHPREVAVLIPSIDLMGGKIVQLVQGEKKALEFDDFEEWIVRFSRFPLVQLIDLDAAIGTGDNRVLLKKFTRRLPCQVGGGIRSVKDGAELLGQGARRIIMGSALVNDGRINEAAAREVTEDLGIDRLTFAIDSRGGKVAIKGWREVTSIPSSEMLAALEPFCAAFLYTHIDTEGLLKGIPLDAVRPLRAITSRQLIVAGGIRSQEEVNELDALGIDAVVGMAIYTGQMKLEGT